MIDYQINPAPMGGVEKEIYEDGRVHINLNGRLGVIKAPRNLIVDDVEIEPGHELQFFFSYIRIVENPYEYDSSDLNPDYGITPTLVGGKLIQVNDTAVEAEIMDTPVEDLRFILKTKELNDALSKESLQNHFGHEVGCTIRDSVKKYQMFGDYTYMHILSRTAAACDARMAGCPMAAMSNSGSGNQGISATMPVVVYAEDHNATEEQMIRALTLSHLTVIYIKQSLGRLCALCGCVVAATGSACGITYLMGGTYQQAEYAVKNMAATLTGMLCDGAKPSCSLKVASGVSTAVMCAMLAMENKSVTAVEGIIDDSVDQSIRNMTKIGKDGMMTTDRLVLDIMTNK